MTKHESPSQRKGRKGGKQSTDEKKLHKREQRLQENLQKAQAEQAKAQARLERAEARLQKRLARVQRLEEHLVQVSQRLGIAQDAALPLQSESSSAPPEVLPVSPPPKEITPDDASLVAVSPFSAQIFVSVSATEITPTPSSPDISTTTGSAAPVTSPASEAGQQARAVAEAVEEEARAATERAREASQRLEVVVEVHHREQKLTQLEADVPLSSEQVTETQPSANEAEYIASEVEDVVLEKASEDEREPSAPAWKDEAITEPEEVILAGEQVLTGSAQEEIQQVAEIAQEEEQLEEGVARTHAEAAAIAAAEAEALAEASSARTRKARIIARQADQELTLVRAAVRNGSLTGEKAEAALQAAERKSTHAHAELDDAEDAEERAISAARNAEAEAEVAEGMAFSAYDRYVDDVDGRAVQAIADQEELQRGGPAELSGEDNERTEERPVVRRQVWRE